MYKLKKLDGFEQTDIMLTCNKCGVESSSFSIWHNGKECPNCKPNDPVVRGWRVFEVECRQLFYRHNIIKMADNPTDINTMQDVIGESILIEV
jgi:hypothetical protein